MIETMLTKLKHLKDVKKINIQVIAMSATFPNLEEMSQWIGGKIYISNFRPIEVKEFAKIGDKIVNQAGDEVRQLPASNQKDRDWLGILPLIMETVKLKW